MTVRAIGAIVPAIAGAAIALANLMQPQMRLLRGFPHLVRLLTRLVSRSSNDKHVWPELRLRP